MRTFRWRYRWAHDLERRVARTLAAFALVVGVSACAVKPEPVPEPETPTAAESLLELVAHAIASTSAEQRRSIEKAEKARFQQTPTYDNLLRLTMVRAFSAALPSELMETRADLQVLANGQHELSPYQRYVALMALIMVDQRLQMGNQIADLQRQIDSLTEIEASLKDNDVNTAPEVSP